MPLGSFHRETGLLLLQRGSPILQRDDGGRWRLDMVGRYEELLGRRVTVEGTRSGFDLLDVARVTRC
jgi:hypothetical protein